MKKFTVVLLRHGELSAWAETPYGQNIYVAIGIQATEPMLAVQAAKQEAYKADKKDGAPSVSLEMYELCVAFEGEHHPKLFGWQAH